MKKSKKEIEATNFNQATEATTTNNLKAPIGNDSKLLGSFLKKRQRERVMLRDKWDKRNKHLNKKIISVFRT